MNAFLMWPSSLPTKLFFNKDPVTSYVSMRVRLCSTSSTCPCMWFPLCILNLLDFFLGCRICLLIFCEFSYLLIFLNHIHVVLIEKYAITLISAFVIMLINICVTVLFLYVSFFMHYMSYLIYSIEKES